ncbi:hypothetical protein HDV01_003432 [Terramyces sp. JEL0728]|nr:hypothetical protein HDV01_003432 [Terramyces sp. JEL0728]
MAGEQLNSCFKALDNAETDEDILVALTILPRILQPADADNVKRAFSHIPWKFIHRMMISPITDGLMQIIAIRIWTCFCTKEFGKKSKLLKRIKPASNLLNSNIELEIKELVLRALIDLIQEEEAAVYYEPAVLENIGQISTTLPELYLHFVQFCIPKFETGLFIAPLSHLLQSDHKFKFQTVPVLIAIWANPNIDIDQASKALPELKSTIKAIMASKLTKDVSEQILVLLALIATHFKEFIYPNIFGELDQKMQESKVLSDTQLLVMATHVTGAEIRVTLDATTSNLQMNDFEALPLLYSFLETDMFQESQDINMLDNLATVFSLKTYSRFTSEESSVSTEEATRLVPLVVFMLQHRLSCIDENPIDFMDGILNMITSDPMILEEFNSLNGYIPLIDSFVQDKANKTNLAGLLMNIIVSSNISMLQMEPLVGLQKKLEAIIKQENDLYCLSVNVLNYLFITRSSKKLQESATIPIGEIVAFVSKRNELPEGSGELWYLNVSGKLISNLSAFTNGHCS